MNSIKVNFSFEDLYILFGKESLNNFTKDTFITKISTDTRSIQNGDSFIAIKGENLDGHSYIDNAIEKGANLIISEEVLKIDQPYIKVKNSIEALGKLANYHRKRFKYPVIAIAGSNGKTTTKEITSLVLSKKYKVLKTEKNYNNKIGTAFTLLNLSDAYNIAVIEIGTSEPGEIFYLSKIVEPTHSLITNIGKEHLEFLIDLDGVEMEETALFAWSKKNNAYTFINVDDPRLKKYVKVLEKRITYGENDDANVKLSFDNAINSNLNLKYEGEQIDVKLQNPGYSNIINSTAAASIGFWLDVPKEKIKEALEEYYPSDDGYARLKIQNIRDYTVINDTYNANPESMEEALNVLANQPSKTKIAVLGDMRELGESSDIEHQNILKLANEKADLVFLFGEEFRSANDKINSNSICFESKEYLAKELKQKINPETCILFKGSRGLKIEEIITMI